MIEDTDDFLFLIDELKKDEIICKGLKGIEKESLRITNENQLSLRPHPGSLGSPLHNRYITTDFSESQLELVTPEFQDISCLDEFLDELHHFVFKNIDDEIIWPLSMPPMIDNHDEIPIADREMLRQIYNTDGFGGLNGLMPNKVSIEEIMNASVEHFMEKYHSYLE